MTAAEQVMEESIVEEIERDKSGDRVRDGNE